MTKETENDSSSAAVAATAELYRSNLLRLQCRELVKESILSLHPSTAAALSQPNAEIETEVKWSNSVKEYLEQVKRVINGMGPMTLSTETTGVKRQAEGKEMKKYWTLFQSDKFLKSHSQDGDDLKKKSVSSSNVRDGRLEVLFPGGKTLQVEEVGCYGAGGMGLTTHRSNGNVLPEIDLAVLLPASSSADGENEVVMTGKDYLNHRYFDKRNLVAIHIAKYFSQKKNRKSIGSVHLSYECNDVRKVALILIPPTATPQSNDVDNDLDNKKRNKRRKVEDDNKQKKKKGKVRFVVRLVFGVQSQLGSATTSAKAQSQCWIPLPRLFPNRSNNRLLMPTSTVSTTTDPTPIYNNTLSEELHRLSTIKLVKQQELYSSPGKQKFNDIVMQMQSFSREGSPSSPQRWRTFDSKFFPETPNEDQQFSGFHDNEKRMRKREMKVIQSKKMRMTMEQNSRKNRKKKRRKKIKVPQTIPTPPP